MSNVPLSQQPWIDLRSDTVTRPSAEMYAAMQAAVLGDDVLLDDPTVAELEALAAKMAGKEAAVFVPSGTMGNQIAVASHTQPGDAMLIEEEAHIVYYEVGGPAIFSNVQTWTIPSNRGTMDPDYLEKRVLKANLHTPGTRLICVENTHNRAGGAIIPLSYMAAYRSIADRHGLIVHLDGARVCNAAVALGVPISEVTKHVDSVSICLSKGLRSPIGSVLCGSEPFIEKARIWRKRLGGGMRQAGLLAACGLVSLTKMVDRLAEDHARARRLATMIAAIDGYEVDRDGVETNIVLVGTQRPAAEVVADLATHNVMCFPVAANRLRLVFHADVSDAQVDAAAAAFASVRP